MVAIHDKSVWAKCEQKYIDVMDWIWKRNTFQKLTTKLKHDSTKTKLKLTSTQLDSSQNDLT